MDTREIVPEAALAALIAACEVCCEHECCGIEAFDFSPLYVAAHLYKGSDSLNGSQVQQILEQLQSLVREASSLPTNGLGFVCSIAGTNQLYSLESIERLASRIRRSIELAPRVFAYSQTLDREIHAGPGSGP